MTSGLDNRYSTNSDQIHKSKHNVLDSFLVAKQILTGNVLKMNIECFDRKQSCVY